MQDYEMTTRDIKWRLKIVLIKLKLDSLLYKS